MHARREGARGEPSRAKPERADGFDLVVLVAAVGGVQALQAILRSLPEGFPSAVAIAQHRRARAPYRLDEILRRSSPLPVRQVAAAGDAVRPGVVHVALPDHHLVIAPDRTLGLLPGRRIRHLASSADPLLESASITFRGRVLAVVLAGGDEAGVDGLQTVQLNGGAIIVQEPETYTGFAGCGMQAATGLADHVLPLEEIGPAIVRLTAGEILEPAEVAEPAIRATRGHTSRPRDASTTQAGRHR